MKSIKNVINYEVARNIESHTHRIGRTGRAGEHGVAYTLVLKKETGFATDLVRHLEAANQIVPPDMLDMAMQVGNAISKALGNVIYRTLGSVKTELASVRAAEEVNPLRPRAVVPVTLIPPPKRKKNNLRADLHLSRHLTCPITFLAEVPKKFY